MLKFYLSNIHTVRPNLSDRQMLLGVEAYFSIIIDNEIFFSEQEFPILEFASQLAAWCRDAAGDFHYESLEIDENPMISFVRQESGDFVIVALDTNFQSDKLWPRDLLVQMRQIILRKCRLSGPTRARLGRSTSRLANTVNQPEQLYESAVAISNFGVA